MVPIPDQLLYVFAGALFSAIASYVLQNRQAHRQADNVRTALLGEMRSSKRVLERIVAADPRERPRKTQIEGELSTQMYEQHVSEIGKLSQDEADLIINFHKRLSSIQGLHWKYNEVRSQDLSGSKIDLYRSSTKMFFSYALKNHAEDALEILQDADQELSTQRASWVERTIARSKGWRA